MSHDRARAHSACFATASESATQLQPLATHPSTLHLQADPEMGADNGRPAATDDTGRTWLEGGVGAGGDAEDWTTSGKEFLTISHLLGGLPPPLQLLLLLSAFLGRTWGAPDAGR